MNRFYFNFPEVKQVGAENGNFKQLSEPLCSLKGYLVELHHKHSYNQQSSKYYIAKYITSGSVRERHRISK